MAHVPVPILRPQRFPLLVFFLLTFLISWGAWIPANLASRGLLTWPLPPTVTNLIGVFGPFLAAVITSIRYDGKGALHQLFRRILIWRVGVGWYAFVLLWPATLSLAITTLHVLFGGAAPNFNQIPIVELAAYPPEVMNLGPWLLLLMFVQQTMLGSSMGEEVGWRGYALPRLLGQMDALSASLLLGLVWALWHLPLYTSLGHPLTGSFGWVLLGLPATVVLFTWVYSNTRGSLLLMLLFHSSIALTGAFLAASAAHPLVGVGLTWAVAFLLVARYGRARLSRQPEGNPSI